MKWLSDRAQWLTDHRFFLLGFAVAVAYWPAMLSPAFTPRWAVIAVGVPFCSTLDPRAVPAWLLGIVAWVLSMAVIATVWASPDPMGGYLELMYVGMLCLAFIAAANMESIDHIMLGIGAGLAISAFMALWAMFPDQGRSNIVSDPTGLFLNKEVYAEFAAIVFVWAVVRVDIFIAAAAVVPLLICNTRIGLASAALGLFYAYRPRSKLLSGAIALAGIAIALALVIYLKEGSADYRVTIWIATLGAWTQFGHGLGWFQAAHPYEEFAHSDALQAVAEAGIAAFALLAIPIVAFRSQGHHAEKAAFAAACFQIVFSFPLHLPASGFIVAVLAGFLVGRRALVRLGVNELGFDDGASVQRRAAAGAGLAGASARRSETIPLRSIRTTPLGLCGTLYSVDPAEAGRANGAA